VNFSETISIVRRALGDAWLREVYKATTSWGLPLKSHPIAQAITSGGECDVVELVGLALYNLAGSAVLIEIPIAMILASRLLPLRANRLANIIAASIVTLINGFLSFIPPLVGWGRPPALPEYLCFATIETVCTVVIVWQARTWPGADAAVAPKLIVGQPAGGISSS